MDVFRLIAIFEDEVLEERVCGERGREKVGGEEGGGVREDGGVGFWKHKRVGGAAVHDGGWWFWWRRRDW